MKILLINWQDPENPHAGGAEIHLYETFTRVRARGHEITWLASGWRGAEPRTVLGGLDVHRAGSRHTFGFACPAYYRRHLAAARYDVVVECLNKVPVFSRFWSRKPIVLLVHHLFGTTAFREASLPVAALTWLLERPIGRVYRGVPVQAMSHSTAEDLADRGIDPAAITVIPSGVDFDFFTPPTSRDRAPDPTFLYLGRLRSYKRVDLILRAFREVASDHSRARLVVAGKGDAEPGLRRLAARLGIGSRVEFTGFVSEEAKRELFRRAWANLYTSPKEGWGITNLEAAACGTPTIASDSPGLRESVVHGKTGILVPHGDVAALATAMSRLAASPDRVESLGAAALDFARGFSWDRTAELTERHLQGQVGSGNETRSHPAHR